MNKAYLFLLIPIIMSCAASTKHLSIKQDFDSEKYLGKWYEIARLDHSFERGLDFVTATYSLREDGKIKVLNEGIRADGSKSEAVGKAYVVDPESKTGHLKVSFFWIFYADYRIIYLDKDYQTAIVTSSNMNYLWILSRKPVLEEREMKQLIYFCGENGFAVDELIFPKQK